jgi:hypothetical protein
LADHGWRKPSGCNPRRAAKAESTTADEPQNPLREESSLSVGKFHVHGAFLIIVRHLIDPSAHGIAAHLPSVVGLQRFGGRTHILYVEAICCCQHLLGSLALSGSLEGSKWKEHSLDT